VGAALVLGLAPAADAQTRPRPRPPRPARPAGQQQGFSLRGFVDVGARSFTSTDSFEAIFGRATGTVFGGGVEVMERRGRHGFFGAVRASRFRDTGERVFRFNNEIFELGIPTTVTITPLVLSGGYRFERWRLVPYGGAGVGWHRYEETSRFAEPSENVDETFRGYHVLGGAEFRVWRWIAVAGEGEWATVPDALGNDPNGISREFNEDDLGGATFRVKVVFGR
jgi:opacity protein-like surface antigen